MLMSVTHADIQERTLSEHVLQFECNMYEAHAQNIPNVVLLILLKLKQAYKNRWR